MKPEAKWFVYIEADTSISWLNLLLLLKRLDSNKSLYFGAQNVIGETTFGHGGSGFVVSNAAAKKLEDLQQRDGRAFVEKWEKITSESCCGDEIVARAFVEVNVHLTPAWPLIQGETVATIDWTQRHWCTPAVTWHHVSPNEIDTMWKFQKAWVDEKGWKTPYLYRDVFQHFVDQHIHVNRTDWINISQDWKFEKPSSADSSFEDSVSDHSDVNRGKPFSKLAEDEQRSVNSFDECAVACLNKEDCKQYMWEPGRCRLGRDIRLGRSEEKGGMGVKSGWMQDRVEDFRRSLEPCQPNWKFG
ncbi:hypothetical protein LTR39_006799 [Cryomyces antarcticus]|nr:hypothetical protein LTR39_006799 [Cryomyces antarcticus]